jgi:tetratricopeptide (TPR) repeat protein
MNAAVMKETCPDVETLAAFSDGTLDAESRLEVMEHVADCGDCRDLIMAVTEYNVENEARPGEVVRGRFGKRWIAQFAAAAAVVAALFGVMPVRELILARNMRELERAANDLPKRTLKARLSGNFNHKDVVPTPRGGVKDQESAQLMVEYLADTAAARARTNPSATNLHTAGVGQVLVKKYEYRQRAVVDLERAVRAEPDSAPILTDLAAAYFSRGDKGDYERALAAANKALSLKSTPAAVWNRALALEELGRRPEAIAAWNEYLEIDPSSPWTEEAKTRLADLHKMQ